MSDSVVETPMDLETATAIITDARKRVTAREPITSADSRRVVEALRALRAASVQRSPRKRAERDDTPMPIF